MVSCFPAVTHRPLFYRQLENEKTSALKISKGNFNENMYVSDLAKQDLVWWIEKAGKDIKPIFDRPFSITLKCDSSKQGWGCIIEETGFTTGGR